MYHIQATQYSNQFAFLFGDKLKDQNKLHVKIAKMTCRNSEILRRELFNSMEQLNDMIFYLTKRAMLQVLKINSILIFFILDPHLLR